MAMQVTKAAAGSAPPTPSLTPRLAALAGSCGTIRWPGEEERVHLPMGLTITAEDRADATARLAELRLALDPATPQSSKDRLRALTKLMLTYSGGIGNEAQAAALMDSYHDAVDDVPGWAVDAAARRWNRKEAGDQNYNFAPRPPILSELARREVQSFRRPIIMLERLLKAEPFEAVMQTRGEQPRGIAPPAGGPSYTGRLLGSASSVVANSLRRMKR